MTFLEAKQTAAKLFGPGLRLHRGKNRCFLIRPDGVPMADGKSWLECLRSAGELVMLQNAKRDAEEAELKKKLEAFVELTKWNPEKLDAEQLEYFDAWMEATDAGTPPPPVPMKVKIA